jgi:hypothetical protein
MPSHMDDPALLRQTIRRCTAVLVATIALTGLILKPTDAGGLLLLVVLGALLYLGNEYITIILRNENTDGSPAESPTANEPSKNG